MKENLLKELSFKFAVRIVELSRSLQELKKEWVLSKQVLRSGTSIGAMVREAEFAQSKPDFIHKMSIALKEANETLYWIELLNATNLIDTETSERLCNDLKLIISLLVKTIKTSKGL
jgi:four helix bundle protein